MYHTFDELIRHIKINTEKKVIAVAAAHDKEVLESAIMARREGIASFLLIGIENKIADLLISLGEDVKDWTILHESDNTAAAERAVSLAAEGKADALMKGLLHTSTFLRALFSKKYNLISPESLVSQITVTEFPSQNRLILITDCAVNMSPAYSDKLRIIENAVSLGHRMGIECPKIACIAPVEVVDEKMSETIDAAMLSKAAQRGQLKHCLVDGPLAMDNALSPEAARTKGILGSVPGQVDVLLMPNLCTGNVLDKALRYFAGLKTGSAVMGANVPIIMTSRSDSAQNKLHAIALSVL